MTPSRTGTSLLLIAASAVAVTAYCEGNQAAGGPSSSKPRSPGPPQPRAH